MLNQHLTVLTEVVDSDFACLILNFFLQLECCVYYALNLKHLLRGRASDPHSDYKLYFFNLS